MGASSVAALLKNAIWISVGVLLGRLAGFFREVSLAAELGVSPDADIAIVLLTFPDALTNLLMGGALSAVLIPRFKKLGGGVRSDALFCKGSLLVGGLFALVAAAAAYRADWMLALLAPGIQGEAESRAIDLLSEIFWVVPLTALAGVSTAYLQARGLFFFPAMGTLIFNGVLVCFIVFSLEGAGLGVVVIAVMCGAALRWASQIAQIRWCRGCSLRTLRWSLLGDGFGWRYIQAVAGGGLITLLPVLARAFASEQGAGSLALFNYAYKLVEFPLGACVTVLSVAVFPALTQAFVRQEDPTESIARVLRWTLVISFSVTTVLWAFSAPVAQLAFGHGKVDLDQVQSIGLLFAAGIISLPLQGVFTFLSSIFYAKGDTVAPFWISAGAFLAFALLGCIGNLLAGGVGVMWALVLLYSALVALQVCALLWRHQIQLWRILHIERFVLLFLVMASCGMILREAEKNFEIAPLLVVTSILLAILLLLVVGLVCMGDLKVFMRWLRREN